MTLIEDYGGEVGSEKFSQHKLSVLRSKSNWKLDEEPKLFYFYFLNLKVF